MTNFLDDEEEMDEEIYSLDDNMSDSLSAGFDSEGNPLPLKPIEGNVRKGLNKDQPLKASPNAVQEEIVSKTQPLDVLSVFNKSEQTFDLTIKLETIGKPLMQTLLNEGIKEEAIVNHLISVMNVEDIALAIIQSVRDAK